jgi:hypothetical protein
VRNSAEDFLPKSQVQQQKRGAKQNDN